MAILDGVKVRPVLDDLKPAFERLAPVRFLVAICAILLVCFAGPAGPRAGAAGTALVRPSATSSLLDEQRTHPQNGLESVAKEQNMPPSKLDGQTVNSEFIFESAPFPSCHASTLVETARHTLVAAWFGGNHEGADDVKIWVSRHEHGAWSPPAMAAFGLDENGHPAACYNPVLFQPKNSPLLLFFKVGHNPSTWRGYVTRSVDDGRSWDPARLLPAGFIGPDKNKPMQLADGTILCGSSTEPNGWKVHFEFTNSTATQWSKTPPVNDSSTISAIQPSLLSLGGGRIVAVGRTAQGKLFSINSEDSGRSCGPMRLIDVPNPNAGIDSTRLSDGRYLLVYNPTARGRKPISVALSEDGERWTRVVDLETGPLEYSYPAVIQTSDGLVHIVYTWRRERIRHVVIDPKLLHFP